MRIIYVYDQIAAKRNPELDREVQNWIETIIEEKFPDVLYEDALKNGVILCKCVFLILNVENVQSQ